MAQGGFAEAMMSKLSRFGRVSVGPVKTLERILAKQADYRAQTKMNLKDFALSGGGVVDIVRCCVVAYCREWEFHVPPASYRRQKKHVPLASIWT